MAALASAVGDTPLTGGQRVLALTFMVGARHKLSERLRSVPGLGGRVECSTIDNFAWRLVRRWRSLLAALGVRAVAEEDYDGQCAAAATLLERAEVASWVAASFPIVLVDEAQDLKPERLRMIAALSAVTELLVAADEFQCLDPALRPNPTVAWLHEVSRPRTLDVVHRTRVRGLLDAATAIRAANAPRSQGAFKIIASKGDNMAPSFVSNAIGWARPVGGTVAILTPSRAGNFSNGVVARVGERATKQGNGPYAIGWERSDNEELDRLVGALLLGDVCELHELQKAFAALGQNPTARAAMRWVQLQARARGRTLFTRAEIVAAIARELKARRQRRSGIGNHLVAMTIHQAKNREFDGVVVLWPYQLGGDAEHKRRLLYNAVTRAKCWCTVVVQNENLLNAAPFA